MRLEAFAGMLALLPAACGVPPELTADLVLVNPVRCTPVVRERVLSRCGWSPFEGRSFSHSIEATWVNGRLAYHEGSVVEQQAAMRLEFDPWPR